jgi:hypothetical protein
MKKTIVKHVESPYANKTYAKVTVNTSLSIRMIKNLDRNVCTTITKCIYVFDFVIGLEYEECGV